MDYLILVILVVIAIEISYVLSRLWQIHKTVYGILKQQGEKDG